MAGKLLLINPKRRRKASKKRRAFVRRNPMPPALARYWTKKRRGVNPKRRRYRRTSTKAATSAGRLLRYRRRNPVNVRGIFNQIVPMTIDATMGAAGAIAMDWAWGQINPRLPANLQSTPGQVGVGDAVKVAATVTLGTLLNRPTRGWSMRAARGALTVQMDRILRSFLPDTVKMQLAYAGPAPVVQGQLWTGPNRVYRGAGVLPNTMGALMRPGGKSPLLNGVGALMRPGGRTPLLNAAPRGGIRVRF